MLICSVAYAQKAPTKSKKNKKTAVTKPVTPPDTITKVVPNDTIPFWANDRVYFDPMDTVQNIRISKSALDKEVKYSADDSMPYNAETRTIYLYRNAQVDFGEMQLKADFIKIELDKNLMTAIGTKDSSGRIRGKPVFTESGTEYKAEIIKYNFKTKKGILSELWTKEGDGYIHGSNVKRNEDNNFGVKYAKYTTCEDEHPHYFIGALKLKVIPNDKIVTGPANLWIEDVPTILAIPFGMFSIKKGQKSGIIIPQYGNSADRGYFLRNGGYYFALGDYHDLQLTGDIFSNGSWAGRSFYRYTNRYHYTGSLGFNYNYNKFGNEEDPDFRLSKDFQLSWLHRSDPKARPNSNFSANVNIVSNEYLANNSYVPQNIVANQLNSSVAYNKGFKNGKHNLSTTARMSQNTYTHDVSISFPDITYTVSSFAPFKPKYKNTADKWYENITTNYNLQFRNDLVTKDSILFQRWGNESGNALQMFLDSSTRFGMLHTIPIQTSFKVMKFYTLSASVSLNDYMYYKTVRRDTTGSTFAYGFENAISYSSRLGLSTRYYGMAQFSKGKLKAIRHVITPTLDFTYAPDFGDPSFGYYKTYKNSAGQDIRYSIFENGIFGGPGIGRQGNIGFAMDNNLELKLTPGKKDTTNTDRKVQIFESIRAGASYNIFADSLQLSVISLSGRTRLFKNVSINGSAALDPYYNQITSINGYEYVTRVNTFYWDKNKSLGIITNANIGLGASFSPEMFGKKTNKRNHYDGELRYINDFPTDYYDFNIPWNLSMNYTVSYYKYQTLNNPTGTNYVQTINFNGDVNVTKNWKVGYSSGYDFREKKITFTSIDFVRNLHCWEFKLNWIPIGPRQSFLFTINVKSSLLQDLKMTRRKDWYDRSL